MALFSKLGWLSACGWGHSKIGELSKLSMEGSPGLASGLRGLGCLVASEGPLSWQNDSEAHSRSPCRYGSHGIGLLVAIVSSGEVRCTEKEGTWVLEVCWVGGWSILPCTSNLVDYCSSKQEIMLVQRTWKNRKCYISYHQCNLIHLKLLLNVKVI